MAPTTRAKTARIAGFPEMPHDGDPHFSHQEREIPLQTVNSRTPTNRNSHVFSVDSVAEADVPPIYTIDLSLPPAQRYVQVAKDYKLIVESLPYIFDDVLGTVGFSKKVFHIIAQIMLQRLYSKEQTEELRGISKATGVDIGGVVVKESGKKQKKMMHFRTLDWGMPALRKAIVQFEFVARPGGDVIARTINYVGFVGVLTGVREALSVSLNFRPYHNNDHSKRSNIRFYGHHLLVLLGLRPSISSHLRDLILPKTKRQRFASAAAQTLTNNFPNMADIVQTFPSVPTTAAYDRVTAKIHSSSSFITATNHDTCYETGPAVHTAHAKTHHFGIGMQELVEESMDRKGCLVAQWEKRCRKSKERGKEHSEKYVHGKTLVRWLAEYPVTNGETHFATIMDPTTGKIAWVRSYEDGMIKDADSE
ncbi:hypothetical protein K469DRAFT_735721 [Zopfia rhizophila CBS 207.26]|uniref:ceramidase n=1 Tax=Zopfia rhizophila CBS 207.26 TaxID=1314779 RepID=A0A6A6ENV8_9PEZI|nr:hypothetical protein K469DRAFT_735721 [Zopfia rhizophila CBS 207.26]